FDLCTAPPPAVLYTLSLHDALPIFMPPPSAPHRGSFGNRCSGKGCPRAPLECRPPRAPAAGAEDRRWPSRGPAYRSRTGPLLLRSEEHTSELQSLTNLVCRLLLEKK